MNRRAFVIQRLTAAMLAPLVASHLVLIILAVRGGLSAGEILARTRGSLGWGLFYGLFVLVVAVHAGIGLRTILEEWSPLGARWSAVVSYGFMVLALVAGARAVVAVVL